MRPVSASRRCATHAADGTRSTGRAASQHMWLTFVSQSFATHVDTHPSTRTLRSSPPAALPAPVPGPGSDQPTSCSTAHALGQCDGNRTCAAVQWLTHSSADTGCSRGPPCPGCACARLRPRSRPVRATCVTHCLRPPVCKCARLRCACVLLLAESRVLQPGRACVPGGVPAGAQACTSELTQAARKSPGIPEHLSCVFLQLLSLHPGTHLPIMPS